MTNIYYKHKYGGIYKFITEAINAEDKQLMMVYEHIYPFDAAVYVKTQNEFNKSFEPITEQQYHLEILQDKHLFQKIISENKKHHKDK